MTPAEEKGGVSVVVAHHAVDPALLACLEAHRAELGPEDELLVVLPEEGARRADQAQGFERAVVVAGARGELTPLLWARGVEKAGGRFVRITIGSFRPRPGWRSALLAAHREADVVGGPMEMGPDLRWRDQALFFQRYRAFRPPLPHRAVADVPADHSSYRRGALAEVREWWRDGFWEREVNAELARRGHRLVLDPGFAAVYVGGESAGRFLVQRFRHGIQFGRQRLTGRGTAVRLGRVAVFLLPGVVFGVRILRESLAVPRTLPRLLAASGWLGLFVLAWSLGEWVGAILGPRPTPPPAAPVSG